MHSLFKSCLSLFALFITVHIQAQSFVFPYPSNGNRVCLVESSVDLIAPSVTVKLLDHASNSNFSTSIYRRPLYGAGNDWMLVASGLPAGTAEWVDINVALGDVWEYQVKRQNTWSFNAQLYDAIGYTVGTVQKDNSNYRGQIILLVSDNIANGLPAKLQKLKTDFTGEGWFVNELVVPRAHGWNSGDTVVGIRNQIKTIYNNAPTGDKPKILFILGHVPMPRSGSTLVTAPDAHDQNKGARGFDGFYADMDGIYTDTATFNPGGLQSSLAINLPNDFKWDQDFFTSDLEMAFGRVDFADLTDVTASELVLTGNYLDRLSKYKNVSAGFNMGNKSAFNSGYQNSNDGSYRTLPNISKASQVFQNTSGINHPQWVQANGPFKIFMQNQILPDVSEWESYGMNATVFSSDQSYWGFNDVPQTGVYSRIRALLGIDSKCLVTLWTTTAANVFHQACTGDALGIALKQGMNHSLTNNRLQRPPQQWDTEDWWNRTHFSYNGDPSLSLYQVEPIGNLSIAPVNGLANLTWDSSPDSGVMGYHIYKSSTELGQYQKITSSPIAQTNFTDSNYQQNDWYMVRAIKPIESGCGKFLHASVGLFVQGTFDLAGLSQLESNNDFLVYPNPNNGSFELKYNSLEKSNAKVSIFTLDGKLVYTKFIDSPNETSMKTALSQGTYLLVFQNERTTLHRNICIE